MTSAKLSYLSEVTKDDTESKRKRKQLTSHLDDPLFQIGQFFLNWPLRKWWTVFWVKFLCCVPLTYVLLICRDWDDSVYYFDSQIFLSLFLQPRRPKLCRVKLKMLLDSPVMGNLSAGLGTTISRLVFVPQHHTFAPHPSCVRYSFVLHKIVL